MSDRTKAMSNPRTALAGALIGTLISLAAPAQERVDGVIQKRGWLGVPIASDEFAVVHDSEFKGARRVAISVFNVAFPSANEYTANTKGSSLLGRTTSASASMSTTLSGVDQATRQRIADKAYALFIEQLEAAGYEVVDHVELARLAPEFSTWAALPNFAPGRFGAYVAPTGRVVRFLKGDSAKRDTSGFLGQQLTPFRALDNSQAFSRSPYIAHDAGIGIIAVTLVVDYGVYSSTGEKSRLYGSAGVAFKPGATIAAGSAIDHGTLIEYWGPNSGGFPAAAFLQKPVYSDREIGVTEGFDDNPDKGKAVVVADVVADPAKFEAAADEVVTIGIAKLVGVMAAAK
jgi:hypothetical protein